MVPTVSPPDRCGQSDAARRCGRNLTDVVLTAIISGVSVAFLVFALAYVWRNRPYRDMGADIGGDLERGC
jgi:hypothetical protein